MIFNTQPASCAISPTHQVLTTKTVLNPPLNHDHPSSLSSSINFVDYRATIIQFGYYIRFNITAKKLLRYEVLCHHRSRSGHHWCQRLGQEWH